jgi:4-aminobutyrate aminotransferase
MTLQESYLLKTLDIFPPVAKDAPSLVIERGEGSYLFDIEGRRYLDFASGIAITPVGHCHPRVVEAITEQSQKLISSLNFLWPKTKIDLAEKLVSIFPKPLNSVFLSSSGTEAIEGALKLARKARPGRPNFIAFQGGFHGRTLGALSITSSKASYRADYFPLIPQTFFVDYPAKINTDKVLEQLEKLFESVCPPTSVAAIFVESILGEGGYIVPPNDFLPKLRQICDRWEILLVADEIQTGFGRTGKWFGFEHSNIVPDIVAFAKGIASGLPLGGFAANKELMQCLNPGSHGSTFGGNPIACAAALATIKIIEQEALIERVAYIGQKIKERLANRFGNYLDIRGKGFMIGIEPKNFDLSVKAILARAQTKGLIALTCGSHGQTIRLIPALNMPDEVLNEGLAILEQIFDYEILVAAECKRSKHQEAIDS